MRQVLALDPGSKVGWASAAIHDDGQWQGLSHGITPLKNCALWVHNELSQPRPPEALYARIDVVVIEDWVLRADKAQEMIGSSFPSSQFIGAVQLSCWLNQTPLVRQRAVAQGKQAQRSLQYLYPDLWETTVRDGLALSHDDSHDMSAILHLWTWTMKNTTMDAYVK